MSSRGSLHGNGSEYGNAQEPNPFTLPSDEEVFRLRDEEKKNRIKQREENMKLKREEIRKLEEKAQMKEEALQKSEQMLEEDAIRFDTFLKENDKKAHEAIKKAEKETKLKTDKVQEIKKLNQQIQMVQSDMSKHKEALEDCLKYKEFLDKLTPPEWVEQQETERRNRAQAIRKGKIDAVREKWEAEKKRVVAAATKKHEAELVAQMNASGKKKRTNRRGEGEQKINVALPPEPDYEKEIPDVEEATEEVPIYFVEPQQLLDVFTALEEQNLFLIQNSQETEQALEDLKTSYRNTRKMMDDKTSTLEANINDLTSQITLEENKAHQLGRRAANSAGDTQERQEILLKNLGDKVKEVYQRCGFDSSSNPSTLFMLSDLEAQLEELLSDLEIMPEEYVKRAEKEKEKKRRELKRIEQQEALAIAQEERNRKAIERSLQPPKKRAGRQVMYRSQPVRRKVKEEKKEITEDDLDELKHLQA
ncbi:hypothetical protein ScalyP_jg10536 [Parmales sp. scaly parma]|nr:hypothetical protein ScalyP_jg10536 [Parmales sp. scaly parma]